MESSNVRTDAHEVNAILDAQNVLQQLFLLEADAVFNPQPLELIKEGFVLVVFFLVLHVINDDVSLLGAIGECTVGFLSTIKG